MKGFKTVKMACKSDCTKKLGLINHSACVETLLEQFLKLGQVIFSDRLKYKVVLAVELGIVTSTVPWDIWEFLEHWIPEEQESIVIWVAWPPVPDVDRHGKLKAIYPYPVLPEVLNERTWSDTH